jgi:hypothetical protein
MGAPEWRSARVKEYGSMGVGEWEEWGEEKIADCRVPVGARTKGADAAPHMDNPAGESRGNAAVEHGVPPTSRDGVQGLPPGEWQVTSDK